MEISIIVPAKNEEKTIKKFVSNLVAAFRNSEIIVVCNGCSDNTFETVESIRRKNIVLTSFGNIGKGGAIIEGLKIAKKPIVGFVDSDGSFDINAIKKILVELGSCDVSIASKWKGKNFFSAKSIFTRKIGGRVWNLLVKIFLGLDIGDTQAGLKFFKKSAYDSISHNFICKGFEFDVELLDKMNRKGYKIREVFVNPKKSKKTTFNISNVPSMFFNLIRLKLNNLQIFSRTR